MEQLTGTGKEVPEKIVGIPKAPLRYRCFLHLFGTCSKRMLRFPKKKSKKTKKKRKKKKKMKNKNKEERQRKEKKQTIRTTGRKGRKNKINNGRQTNRKKEQTRE